MLKTENTSESWEWHTTFIDSLMQHNYRLYYIIDSLFQNNDFHSVVEIGTGCGALTTVLGLWGIKLDIPVISIDIETKHNKKIFDTLHINFLKLDEFSLEAKEKITSSIGDKSTLLICDGGLKKWEFNTFASLTPINSIIGVHDWGVECIYEDIKDTIVEYCRAYQESRWNEMNVQFATFKRK